MRMRWRFLGIIVLCCMISLFPVTAVYAEGQGNEPDEILTETIDLSDGIIQCGAICGPQSVPWGSTFYDVWSERRQEAIYQGLLSKQETIDLTAYNIPKTDIGDIYMKVVNENPDLFYVRTALSYSFNSTTSYVTSITPTYYTDLMTDAARSAFDNAVNQALLTALGSTDGAGMSDLQKALAIHDYLVLNCQYDYKVANNIAGEDTKVYSAYGTLVNKNAVCQGIALAYQLLLKKVDVGAGYVSSQSMNHAWNWVNIGDYFYHVDATWDDPVYTANGKKSDLPGYCDHKYFLRSNANLEGHNGYTQISQTNDAYLSGYLFNNCESAFFWNNGKFYYLMNDTVKTTVNLVGTYSSPNHQNRITLRCDDMLYYFYDVYYSNQPTKLRCYSLNSGNTYDVGVPSQSYSQTYGLRRSGDYVQCVAINGTTTPDVIASYAIQSDVFTVTFHTNGGSSVDSQRIATGRKVTKPSDPTRADYIFLGWYKESACRNKWNFDSDIVNANITLYAGWKENLLVQSGTCGAQGVSLSWTLQKDGLLTISGYGAMADWESVSDVPWNPGRTDYPIKTVVLKGGITNIGKNAFNGSSSLTSITIPSNVTRFGDNAFSNGSAGLTIYGAASSAAQTYAEDNGITFVPISLPYTAMEDNTAVHGMIFGLLLATTLCFQVLMRKSGKKSGMN